MLDKLIDFLFGATPDYYHDCAECGCEITEDNVSYMPITIGNSSIKSPLCSDCDDILSDEIAEMTRNVTLGTYDGK